MRISFIIQGPKNFRIFTRLPAILHLSNSSTKKDNPLALTKFFLVRMSKREDSVDSVILFMIDLYQDNHMRAFVNFFFKKLILRNC